MMMCVERLAEVKASAEKLRSDIAAEDTKFNTRLKAVAQEVGVEADGSGSDPVEVLKRRGAEFSESQCSSVVAQLSSVSSALAALAKRTEQHSKTTQLSHTHALAVQRVSSIQTTADVYRKQLASYQAELVQIEADRAAATAQESSLRQLSHVYEFWDNAWGKKSGSMRTFLLDHSLTELNGVLRTVLTALSDDGVRVHDLGAALDGTLQVVAASTMSEGGGGGSASAAASAGGVEYAKRSGGQRRRTDLAIFFGLLELATQRTRYRSQYIILDEIFDSLDQSGQDAVQRWISTLTKRMRKVFVISHSPTAAGRGLNTLHVTMSARGTQIVDSTRVMESRGLSNAGRSSANVATSGPGLSFGYFLSCCAVLLYADRLLYCIVDGNDANEEDASDPDEDTDSHDDEPAPPPPPPPPKPATRNRRTAAAAAAK